MIVLGIVVVVVCFFLLGGVKGWQIKTMVDFGAAYQQPPETVSTALAQPAAWHDTLSAVGSVNAEQGVMVAPEIGGTVSEIDFESGANVTKGDLLLRMDTSTEEAQLRAAQAQVDWAKVSAERLRKLRADSTASQSELDQAEATLKQAQANADAISATINKKTIRAPFTGQLGIRQVDLGEQITAGKTIVSLQSLVPVFVDFSLPQQDLAKISTGLAVKVTSDTYPGQNFQGEITAINPDLDTVTRSVRVRAKIANEEKMLRPGMFVHAEVTLPGDVNVLVIPATALKSAPYGDSVFVVGTETNQANGKTIQVVEEKLIRTGRSQGDFVSVETGLNAGDKVVTAGVFKLRKGTAITENNDVAPKTSATPQPPNT